MAKKINLTKEIESNITQALAYAESGDYTQCILIELETARLIAEDNFQLTSKLIISQNKLITDLKAEIQELKKPNWFTKLFKL
jgi:hypothetical protein